MYRKGTGTQEEMFIRVIKKLAMIIRILFKHSNEILEYRFKGCGYLYIGNSTE
jgi:hypothetical protein